MPGSARIWGRCPEAQGCRRDRPRVDSLLACSPARAIKPQPVSSDALEVIRAMRKDMNKVVVERERGGSTRQKPRVGQASPICSGCRLRGSTQVRIVGPEAAVWLRLQVVHRRAWAARGILAHAISGGPGTRCTANCATVSTFAR